MSIVSDRIAGSTLFAMNLREKAAVSERLTTFRAAVRERRKVRLEYLDRGNQPTVRTVWPLGLFYWGLTWTAGSYCELRDDFRNFRLDRITKLDVTDERFTPTRGRTLQDLFEYYRRTTTP